MNLFNNSVALIVGFLLPKIAVCLQSTNLTVDVGYAKYQGFHNTSANVNSWLGVYYAEPPTRSLRWRPPVPIDSNTTQQPPATINATRLGPVCPQTYPAWRYNSTPGSSTQVYGNEDCLLLDIHTPTQPKSTQLPILLQIHGGGYTQNFAEYSPGYAIINASKGNLIYVTIQYRLGAYGFLSSDEIKSDGTANVGLLDQEAAILWVKRNIHAFGGDASKITIVGGSAGGGSVMAHLISRGGSSNPPFRAAIAEYPWWQQFRTDERLSKQFETLLQATSCTNLACLRSVPEKDLLQAVQSAMLSAYPQEYGYGDFYFGPTVDGTFIRDLPSNEFQNGHFAKVPLITNRDGYEGYGYTNKSLNTTSGTAGLPRLISDIQALFPPATRPFLSRLLQIYPASDYNSTFWQRSAAFSDAVVNCGSYRMASRMSTFVPTWKFVFRTGSQLHGADSPFLWDSTFGASPRQNLTTANILKDYYLSFITNLDPNAVTYTNSSKPLWPVYLNNSTDITTAVTNDLDFRVLEFNDTNIEARRDPDAGSTCDFWAAENEVCRN